MKTTRKVSSLTATLTLFGTLVMGAQAATLINIRVDGVNSDTGGGGAFWNQPDNVVTDTGAYDPNNPTAAAFSRDYANDFFAGWHGNAADFVDADGTYTLSFLTLNSAQGVDTAYTTTAANSLVALDFYGRSDMVSTADNNYTVTLFNGTGQVAQMTGQMASDDAAAYNRTVFNLGANKTFDSFKITTPSTGATADFAVAEVRLVSLDAVPEPSSTALLGLGGLALLLRRHK